MGKLEGKVAVITGASGGLGKQIAIRFAHEGAKLAICARTEDRLLETEQLCEQAGAQVLAFPCDVAEYEQLKVFVDKTVERFGTVDVLVNNAVSIAAPHPFLDHEVDILEITLHSGFYATWHLMKLCFPYMKDKSASIINFGSGAGVLGMEGYAAYAATKEAIRALSRVVAKEWGVYGIRVNVLCPGAITDNVKAGLEYLPEEMKEYVVQSLTTNPFHRGGEPYEDITPVALFLACDDSQWLTGQTLHAEGGAWMNA